MPSVFVRACIFVSLLGLGKPGIPKYRNPSLACVHVATGYLHEPGTFRKTFVLGWMSKGRLHFGALHKGNVWLRVGLFMECV